MGGPNPGRLDPGKEGGETTNKHRERKQLLKKLRPRKFLRNPDPGHMAEK